MIDAEPQFVDLGGQRLAYLASGPADGPLAVAIHGFPDTAWTWRLLAPVLAGAGYRVVMPWQRGYAPSALAPDGQYGFGALAADVNALHAALGGDERAVLIGHDFGASAAYGAAVAAPQRWSRLVMLAVPPRASIAEKRLRYDQLRRSWYMYFFQLPIAESVVAADDFALIERLWRDWSPGYDPSGDLPHVKRAFAGDHLTGVLAYYRAMFGAVPVAERYAREQAAVTQPPAVPVLYLHGIDDGCLGIELMDEVEAFLPVAGSRVERVPNAGHFLHLEQPAVVNAAIVTFLRG